MVSIVGVTLPVPLVVALVSIDRLVVAANAAIWTTKCDTSEDDADKVHDAKEVVADGTEETRPPVESATHHREEVEAHDD